MQQALRAAKTVRLEVQQDYDFPSAEAEGLAGLTNEALETLTGKAFASGDEWLRWWKENSGKPFVRPPIKIPTEEPHP